jgi:hypothetical protein
MHHLYKWRINSVCDRHEKIAAKLGAEFNFWMAGKPKCRSFDLMTAEAGNVLFIRQVIHSSLPNPSELGKKIALGWGNLCLLPALWHDVETWMKFSKLSS